MSPWRRNPGTFGAIVSDDETGHDDEQNVEAYGGHLVCESVSPRFARLLLASPDLLVALEKLTAAAGDLPASAGTRAMREALAEANAALVKAGGGR